MGKAAGKKRNTGTNSNNSTPKHKHDGSGPKAFDEDTNIFISMSHELKEEGNKLFQKRDYEGALLKYEKAVKLLPWSHVDIAYLRSNIAACYMQMGPDEFHKAINECNLALEVSPKYSKALLKRAKCFEGLNKLDLAFKDVETVLSSEPNNLTALEISHRVKKALEKKGINSDDKSVASSVKEKTRRKKSHHKPEDKAVMAENGENDKEKPVEFIKEEPSKEILKEEQPSKVMKLVFGEDIRVAQLPANCSLVQLREIVRSRFPSSKAVLIKFKDKEGDLVTITSTEELRWAEECADPTASVRLYLVEVDPQLEPSFEEGYKCEEPQRYFRAQNSVSENNITRQEEGCTSTYIEEWIMEFARLFKNHVGFESDAYLNIHELGMKLYSEAMEDAVTSDEAQEIFDTVEEKFQEMVALALFNWGNVHMSRARKRLFLSEEAARDSVLAQVRSSYDWAMGEYVRARKRYEEALRIKPDFYEAHLALGQQQFEQGKLSWYFAIGSQMDLETWPSSEVLKLFDSAEESMEKGTDMWEKMEEQRFLELNKPSKEKLLVQKFGLSELFRELSTDEVAEQTSNMRSQINILWGTLLYERSVVEFKLGLPTWEESLVAAIEKFKLAGASPSDIAVMVKSHFSNVTAQEGLEFKIDEIVQAWNEMYDAKRWLSGIPSFRLEPLFRRRAPKLHSMLEHLSISCY